MSEYNAESSLTNAEIRQFIDEIIFADKKHLGPVDKIVALGILHFTNRKTGSTFVDLLTVAQYVGIKHPLVLESAKRLVSDHRLSIRPREGRTPLLTPLLRKDTILRLTKGDQAFYAARADLIELIISNRDLTAGARLVALGLMATADTEWRSNIGQVRLAKQVGVSRVTISKTVPALIEHGYFSEVVTVAGKEQAIIVETRPQLPIDYGSERRERANAAGSRGICQTLVATNAKCPSNAFKHLADKLEVQPDENPDEGGVKQGVNWGVNWGVNRTSENARQMGVSVDNLVDLSNLSNLPYSKKSTAPSAARNGRPNTIRFDRDEWEAFHQLVGLIIDSSKGGMHKTVGGIVTVSRGDNPGGITHACDYIYEAADIQKFVRAGLLARDGQRISITELGDRAYDWIEQGNQQKEAA